jgi:VWFA-related protein
MPKSRPNLAEKDRMSIVSRLRLLLLVALLCAAQGSAWQYHAPTILGDGKIHLDVVVTPKYGPPVSGLQREDFTVLDNKVPQTISAFKAVDGRRSPIDVILLVDAVNNGAREVAIAREGINRFLKDDGGVLGYSTAVAILTDNGIRFQGEFSRDGNAIFDALAHYVIPLRVVNGATDYGASGRAKATLLGLGQLVTSEGSKPGRKIVVWLSAPSLLIFGPRPWLDSKTEEKAFGSIIDTSTQLRNARISLYSVDPAGIADIGGDSSNWEEFVKGVTGPAQAQMDNLALGVIAVQSGGLALSSSNDIAAQLRKCVSDASAYYEISFDPATSDRPYEYHQLEVRVAQRGLTARTRQGYYSQARETGKLAGTESLSAAPEPVSQSEPLASGGGRSQDPETHPYLDLPLTQLVDRIPELKGLRPAADQKELPATLEKMGQRVDAFAQNIVDLIANEDLTQEKLDIKGHLKSKAHEQDNYLIVHHGYEWGAKAEYRMDDDGNRLGPVGLEKGYLVTSGYALGCIAFSTSAQSESRFRYLGEQNIEGGGTYVLGFAQIPGDATFFTTMRGTGGEDVDMLTQGILWVDKNSFQVIRMRTDLLAAHSEIQLDRLTTEIVFGEVVLQDVASPLWLPSKVTVSIEVGGQKFRNIHEYKNYRRYRVSVKVVAP